MISGALYNRSEGFAMESPGDVTILLAQMRSGNGDALQQLLPLIYNELRRIAAHYMRQESAGHTLQPTALVHEAYLRLVNQNRANWQNRAQFMGVAGQLMRRILVDHARKRCAGKRGGSLLTLDENAARQLADVSRPEEILAVHLTLERLERLDPQQGTLVELRYFAGLSAEETAEAMGLSLRTVEREWTTAKAWLRAQLAGDES
jgi:RNA polymerase sigma-70 factor, ECF subfamily